MPLPRISGILHNCLFHASVPELLTAIKYFAFAEMRYVKTVPPEDYDTYMLIGLEQYRANYEKLKNEFAFFYGIPQDKLTWKRLSHLLTTSIHHNQAAAQFILGPVLRNFITVEPEVIQDNGRYSFPDTEVVGKKLYEPLGMRLISHQTRHDYGNHYQVVEENEVPHPVFTIDVYNEDVNHWERAPRSELPQLQNDIEQLARDCPAIAEAYDQINSNIDKKNSLQAIYYLRATVNQEFKKLSLGANRKKMVKDLLALEHHGFFNAIPDQFKLPATTYHMDNASANFGESDAEFAARLQDAEIRAHLLKL